MANYNKNSSGRRPVLGTWMARLTKTKSSLYADEMDEKMKNMAVEEIVSPLQQVIRNFFERKLAVTALCVLIGMFITVFVGPLFMPTYYDAYTEVTQKSIAPTMSMMSVPSELKDDIKMIDGYGSFTVGLSNAGKVYVWGSTQIGTTGFDVADIPEDVQNANIVMVAAGIDHIIAIDDQGIVHAWGNNRLGQYGTQAEAEAKGEAINPNIAYMPEELVTTGIDVSNIKKLTCGYQTSAIIMNDGSFYLWGNKLTYANMDLFLNAGSMYDMDFTLNYIVGINGMRNSIYTGSRGLYDVVRETIGGEATPIAQYLAGRKIETITAANNNMCLLLDDGSVCFAGDFTGKQTPVPTLAADEDFVQIVAGSYHYSGLTNKGNIYSWGSNTLNQTNVASGYAGATKLYSGGFQTYAVNDSDDLTAKWGLKGYLFGTDTSGADIFQRIINGGKMTMTIGAVAVIISSVIGIIIGCLSGYFGGKVDILLMRIAEIFNAIPFLPFAMILSAVMGRMTLSENTRIFIIMCILGVLTWPGLARLVRGQVLVARESEYVTAAKAMGVKEGAIAFKHILPNVMSVILVNLILNFGTCMLTESSLSYLGFGVTYPRPTWGNMLNGANNATIINAYWWQWLFTAIFLALTCICINIVGDALRDAMDPKSNSR
ncbi:MAG: ABC transporter permease subunit [Oscillospiraceae bacterium]|nr:ABC transporter permease subunit [Oscillospiraceae bacterium]